MATRSPIDWAPPGRRKLTCSMPAASSSITDASTIRRTLRTLRRAICVRRLTNCWPASQSAKPVAQLSDARSSEFRSFVAQVANLRFPNCLHAPKLRACAISECVCAYLSFLSAWPSIFRLASRRLLSYHQQVLRNRWEKHFRSIWIGRRLTAGRPRRAPLHVTGRFLRHSFAIIRSSTLCPLRSLALALHVRQTRFERSTSTV